MIIKIENIGMLSYMWAIATGRSYRVSDIECGGERLDKGYFLTVHKRFVVLTELKDGKRSPLIVKRWEKQDDLYSFLRTSETAKITDYLDRDGWKWTLNPGDRIGGSSLCAYDTEGKEILTIWTR